MSQSRPEAHTFPQVPQLFGSLVVLTQDPLHRVLGLSHGPPSPPPLLPPLLPPLEVPSALPSSPSPEPW